MTEKVEAARAELARRQAVAAARAEMQRRQAEALRLSEIPPRADAVSPYRPPKPDRFGDTVRAATEGPIAATKAFAAGLVDQDVSPTRGAIPEWVPGAVAAPAAYVGDAAMTGLAAAGTAYAGAAGIAGEVFGGSPTRERQLARDLMLMGESFAGAPGAAGSMNRMARGARAAAAVNRVATPVRAGARAADDLGILPSLGMSGKTGGMIAAGLEKVPFSGSVIARDAARAVGDIEDVFVKTRSKIGPASSPQAAGDVLQKGLSDYVVRFKARSDDLYGEVGKFIPGDSRLKLDRTNATISEVKSVFAGNPALAKKLGVNNWDDVLEEAQTNGISWDAVRQFRSEVGEAIGTGRGSLGDDSVARLKRLYGALTEDMEAMALSSGKPAEAAWQRANAYYLQGAQRVEKFLDQSINASSPERAFEAFAAMTKADRSSSDVKRMRMIKASMKPSEWNEVSAGIVDRLGKAKPGQQGADGATFSPSTFLTEWNRMTPEAKALLLPEDVRIEFNKLAQVAERAKAANAERNFSNTGTPLGIAALMYTSAADLGLAATAVGGANLSARAFTSPTFLRALNKAARGDTKQLRAMAKGNSPYAIDAQTILRMSAIEATGGGAANNRNSPLSVAN